VGLLVRAQLGEFEKVRRQECLWAFSSSLSWQK